MHAFTHTFATLSSCAPSPGFTNPLALLQFYIFIFGLGQLHGRNSRLNVVQLTSPCHLHNFIFYLLSNSFSCIAKNNPTLPSMSYPCPSFGGASNHCRLSHRLFKEPVGLHPINPLSTPFHTHMHFARLFSHTRASRHSKACRLVCRGV